MNLVTLFSKSQGISNWLEVIQDSQDGKYLLTGLSGSAKVLAIASLLEKVKEPILLIAPNLLAANQLYEDLGNVVPENQLYLFSVDEITTLEMSFSSPEAMADRVAALDFLNSKQPGIVIAPVAGVKKWLPSPALWENAKISAEVGETFVYENLSEKLVMMGYERQHMVGKPGDFSLRGSIIDIYPLNTAFPIRIDLFDVEVDSLRFFDVETQRSVEEIKQITILPATDQLFTTEQLQKGARSLREDVEKQAAVLTNPQEKADFENNFAVLLENWEKGLPTEWDRMYLDYLYTKKTHISEYLSGTSQLVLDDFGRILEVDRESLEEEAQWMVSKLEEKKVFNHQKFSTPIRDVLKTISQPMTYFSLFQKGMGHVRFREIYPIQCRHMQQFFSQIPMLKVEVERWKKRGFTVIVYCDSEERRKHIENIFDDYDLKIVDTRPDELLVGETQLVSARLQTGFELPDDQLVVITEREIFQVKSKKKVRRQSISNAERLRDYNELSPGDYVVHINHGIGKYLGMETIEREGMHQDYLTILYQKDDKLFIPVAQLSQIQKYVASEGKTPKINKLGGTEWHKTRSKVSAKIEDIADDLIQLYASREAERGFAFSPDDALQKAFEDAFPYSETDDQLRSAAEIKHDMEQPKPMDRLLVGDVGYGKTEVALRGAFKAVQDSKQVAILVPTTILAQQHYETMVDRFAGFPVKVAVLSRFRTKKEQEATITALRKGEIDIVVGTHRLLSKDIVFQDLGLLVIDEEQRFGVKHKERLKQLRSQVDVLTLTATPIPRTLHMSMLGVRDLSVIETPPADRYPIQTYVMEKNLGGIREAIEREIARGGQVFYLNNRVDTISTRVDEIQSLVPGARVAFAHGQMSEIQLENILYDFIEGQYDVLVSTTIIETGVDIPNVNTLFVENSDYMGLSTLYQLRGRVGRSNRIAFAYFMYEPQKVLSEASEKRLQAIKEFTELGSGFKIAMRDLSIRGAGNLLGAQQHGFIDAVGFDLYAQLLEEAVARKQGKNKEIQRVNTEIDLGLDAYLPESYMQDERQKIEIYKRIRQLETVEMWDELESDLLDRFGEYPDEVANLLTIGRMRISTDYALVDRVKRKGQHVEFVMSRAGTQFFQGTRIFEALSSTTLKAQVNTEKDCLVITLLFPAKMKEKVWLQELVQFVEKMYQLKMASAK